ncbi:hypothetical protein GQ600_4952 [Phytophthora cactorum]|nr:hypothetical protein GQ600_4952 [Phytophthora cactorum]
MDAFDFRVEPDALLAIRPTGDIHGSTCELQNCLRLLILPSPRRSRRSVAKSCSSFVSGSKRKLVALDSNSRLIVSLVGNLKVSDCNKLLRQLDGKGSQHEESLEAITRFCFVRCDCGTPECLSVEKITLSFMNIVETPSIQYSAILLTLN